METSSLSQFEISCHSFGLVLFSILGKLSLAIGHCFEVFSE